LSSEYSAEFRNSLLDDFFTEGDEHLTNIRQLLVVLEKSIGRPQPNEVVEDLFRNFHSLKGISAIVGLRAAEELAHVTEDFLREIGKENGTLSREGIDVLMSSTQRLEQILVAFRTGANIPSYESVLEQVKAVCSPAAQSSDRSTMSRVNASEGTNGLPHALEEARNRGLVLWKCTFTPTRELDGQGINVNSVRLRLKESGEILDSAPRVLADGGITFEYFVGMRETPADITTWEKEGIVVELVEQGAAAGRGGRRNTNTKEVQQESSNPFVAPSHVVRVDLKRLDELMRITGEMVIHRSRFEKELNQSSRAGEGVDVRKLQEVNLKISKSLRDLRDAIMRVRLVSVAEVFARMPFVVRDLARESNKEARLTLEGQQTEIDKYLVEQIKDPILHLVRNAFSHGVEPVEERRRLGKPEEATILLKAETVGDCVMMVVRDDGRGIDKKAVLKRARETGMDVPEVLDSAALLKILCSPGFSTRKEVDRAAGRGVGMAVVETRVRELGGTISVETEENWGTEFTLRLPLTLAIAETLIVTSAEQTCAVPQSFVSEVLEVSEEAICRVNQLEVIPYRGGVLPIVRLAGLFGFREKAATRFLLVLTSSRGDTGLLVEEIHGQREVVVSAIRDPLIQVRGVAGATELGDGRPVLILDATVLTSGPVRPSRKKTLGLKEELLYAS
jgi:two-component system, chemotaxis family, sensor kinase CheA